MRIIFTGFFLIATLFLKGQDAFFQWKQLHPERWIANNDSISNSIPAPQIQLGNSLFSEVWAKNLMKKKKMERDLTVRFLVLSAGLSDFIQDSINNLEFRKKALEMDSLPERHQLAIQGIEKMQLGIKELPKQWWPMLIEKELAVLEWEKHEELISQLGSLAEYSPHDLDSIWMVGMIRNYQESLSLKNQLLPWYGGLIRSKQVFFLKASESSAMMGKNWRYFWGCDSSNKPFAAEKWKSLVSENQFKTVERDRQKEELYFSDLQKNRENWEFLDKRENTLERMRAYVRQYDLVFFQEDSIRGIGIMRARSPQELIDLKRERERWRIGYYQKGMAQLSEIGEGIEGGPTVQDYSKQKGYFKLKDIQNVKKQAIGPLTAEIIQEEKETINPVKSLMMLQILDWNELPNTFKTLK